jgi:hypothetical protein
MLAPVSGERRTRALEFGIYRDGDNNLDGVQAAVLDQATRASAADRTIEFSVEDTTSRRGFEPAHELRTESYTLTDGMPHHVALSPAHDMASRSNLARFVAATLDNAERSGAQQTWIDLVDHGAGDGGGLESDHGTTGVMRADDIAGAIADGVALHAKAHPEDGARSVDGVVANECLMASLGFAHALSGAGVRFLAASPETMLAPGVPSTVALDIAQHAGDPGAMSRAIVDRVMDTAYRAGPGESFGPAAAFDVLDLDVARTAAVEAAVKNLDDALVGAAHERSNRAAIREDARAINGMVRFPQGKHLPWRADRPAIALYDTFAQDGRLPENVRVASRAAADATRAIVLAHRESDDFAPFGGADYSNAAGPTVHFPVGARQIDPWAPQVSETDNDFYRAVDGRAVATIVA